MGKLIADISSAFWGWPLIILLLGTHIFLTFRLGFIQKYIFKAIKLSVTKDPDAQGDVSQFSALATALAATIGTGNIVGVATAIGIGGPGAVFWTWITGVFGIATKYAEGLLAVKYRVKTSDGTMAGGPMYVLQYGLKQKWLGVLFAVFGSIAAFGIGCMVQSNSIAGMMKSTFGINPLISGIVMTILTGLVVLGGLKSIARVCEVLVPFMAIFYVIGCIVLLCIGYKTVGNAAMTILKTAFTGQAALGGFVGSTLIMAMRYGVARGLFSNESGLGSAPIVAAAAQTRNPVRQALVSSTGTFWDTVVVCLLTGLVLVNSGLWQEGYVGAELSSKAFGQIPVVGPIILTVALFAFVYSTILGWAYYAEKTVEYLFGKKAILPYRLLYTAGVFVGAIYAQSLVWDLADLFNGLMAIPNIISLLLLNGVLIKETKKYLWDNNLDAYSDDKIIEIGNKSSISS